MLEFKPINLNGRILVLSLLGDHMGDITEETTGFVLSPSMHQLTAFSAAMLREIADKLDELNDEWDQEVKRGLSESLTEHLSKQLGDAVRRDDGQSYDGY